MHKVTISLLELLIAAKKQRRLTVPPIVKSDPISSNQTKFRPVFSNKSDQTQAQKLLTMLGCVKLCRLKQRPQGKLGQIVPFPPTVHAASNSENRFSPLYITRSDFEQAIQTFFGPHFSKSPSSGHNWGHWIYSVMLHPCIYQSYVMFWQVKLK